MTPTDHRTAAPPPQWRVRRARTVLTTHKTEQTAASGCGTPRGSDRDMGDAGKATKGPRRDAGPAVHAWPDVTHLAALSANGHPKAPVLCSHWARQLRKVLQQRDRPQTGNSDTFWKTGDIPSSLVVTTREDKSLRILPQEGARGMGQTSHPEQRKSRLMTG